MGPAFDLKTHVQPKVSNHDPELAGTTADNGDSVDCDLYSGPVYAVAQVADPTGTPDSFTVTATVEESTTGSGSWTAAVHTALVLSTAKTAGMVRVHRSKRYVRVVLTPAFVGGSTPKIHASSLVLGQLQDA